MPSFVCFLLSLQGAWAALRIQVPSSPVQTGPRSDAYLPCQFSLDPPSTIRVDLLAVRWSLGGKTIARFDTSIEAFRPRGAVLDEKGLRQGNATLLLPDVRDEDAGEYMCSVLHTPDGAERKVALKIEVPPRLSLGPTEVLLLKLNTLACVASDFYPGNVSVNWLRDGEILKADSPSVHQWPNGLFFAQSVLEFTPQISDVGVTFSCHIHHRAAKDPIHQDFELKVKARPELHMYSWPRGRQFLVAKCLALEFYPQNIKVQWFENGKPMQQRIYESGITQNPNGTFSTGSVFFPQQNNSAANFTCQVQHESLEAPLEIMIHWEPRGFFQIHKAWLLALFGFVFGLVVGGGATMIYLKKRAEKAQAVLTDENLLKMGEDAERQEGIAK